MTGTETVDQGFPLRPPTSALAPWFYETARRLGTQVRHRLRVTDQYRFEDRGTRAATLVCFLASKKPELWAHTLPRVVAATNGSDYDVCLVTPGVHNNSLRDYCRAHAWSYLSTATADVSLAQNVCYRIHSEAKFIVKIEEDIFVEPSTISRLVERLASLSADGTFEPGLVAPLVPLEPFASRYALVQLGLLEAFESRFGPLPMSGPDCPVRSNAETVRWIWQHTSPLSRTAKWFANHGDKVMFVPVRYAPGVAAFQRNFWQDIGYFPVSRGRLMIGQDMRGADGSHLCSEAVRRSRPVVIAADIVAARFSFDHQYHNLKSILDLEPSWFANGTSSDNIW